MAGIDKTYGNFDQYLKLKDWLIGKTYKDGKAVISPIDFLCDYNCAKSASHTGKDFVFWNTPTYFDIWLMKNCPLDFIQERLHEQYDYDEVFAESSEYTSFKRSNKETKFKIVKRPNHHTIKGGGLYWLVDVRRNCDNEWFGFDNYNKTWVPCYSSLYYDDSSISIKEMDERKVARLVKNWKLPAGLTICFNGPYVGQTYIVETL
jgi:hypothetical protein